MMKPNSLSRFNSSKMVFPSWVLLICMSVFCISGVHAQNATVKFAADKSLRGASVSAVIFDIHTGEFLETYEKDQRLSPASVWKLGTTIAAIDILGSDFRFRTVLAYRGKIENGVLKGDVIILGGGDPSLGSGYFQMDFESLMNRWVSAIKKMGIDKIEGNIIGNAGHFQGDGIPRTRIWEDMANYYGTGVSGLIIHDNTYTIRFRTPSQPDALAEIINVSPEVPGLNLSSEVLSSTIQSDKAYIFGSPLDNRRVVRGTLPLGRDLFEIKGSIPDPPLFTAFHLHKRLGASGVTIDGTYTAEHTFVHEPATLKTIDVVISPHLSELVAHTNKQSDNLFAETFLFQLGAQNGVPTLEGGLAVLDQYYADICQKDYSFFIYDGSGLSRFNAVSADQMAKIILHAAHSEKLKSTVLDKLPLAGKEGSMRYFAKNTNLDGNLRGKSGSMEKVRAYAGNFASFSSREIGFVVLVNNFDGDATAMRKLIEKWLVEIYGDY